MIFSLIKFLDHKMKPKKKRIWLAMLISTFLFPSFSHRVDWSGVTWHGWEPNMMLWIFILSTLIYRWYFSRQKERSSLYIMGIKFNLLWDFALELWIFRFSTFQKYWSGNDILWPLKILTINIHFSTIMVILPIAYI